MKIRADFNGLFRAEDGLLLCLSHTDTAESDSGTEIDLAEGMILTAYEPDIDDDGNRDELIATGQVVPSPSWLKCSGSKWSLAINDRGWCHASDINTKE